jgi:DNA-binding transcriptional ArsR family regulator
MTYSKLHNLFAAADGYDDWECQLACDGDMRMKKDPLEPRRCAELLAALAAPERLQIVRLLADGPHNVTQITDALKIAPLNVNHHLTVLKHANLIHSEKQGRFVIYSLRAGVMHEVIQAGIPKEALDLGCCQIMLPKGK